MKITNFLSKQSKPVLIALGAVLVVLVGSLDYLTGVELSFSILYLIPIALTAWLVSRWAGVTISIASAIAWFLADQSAGHIHSHPTIPYWNAGVRLGFFLIVTYTLSALHAVQERQEELMQFIVHDLRSPLANVLTGLQTLQDIAGDTLDATQKDLVEMCIVSCDRMATLISSLLDLASLESGHLPLQREQINVKELVEASIKQVALWAKRRRVALVPQLDTDIQTVYADPSATVRVLVNLISNAIKFSPSESTITIRAAPANTGLLAFSVIDQGTGIPPEWANKVFDKFAQVEAHKGGSRVGSGLGLTFCRTAVEAQGGRIWLESQVGKGTMVTFTLPVT